MQPVVRLNAQNFFEHIACHLQTADSYILKDHDAIDFILAMRDIVVNGRPYTSGKAILELVLYDNDDQTPQVVFQHGPMFVCIIRESMRPMAIITSHSLRLAEILKDLIIELDPQILVTLQQLATGHSEAAFVDDIQEDPADAIIIFRPDLIPLSDCYQDLRKLGFAGLVMRPGLINIPYEHWIGGLHYEVTPVKDEQVEGFCDFEDEHLWDKVCYYVPKYYLFPQQ
jgi:hypothetical protein